MCVLLLLHAKAICVCGKIERESVDNTKFFCGLRRALKLWWIEKKSLSRRSCRVLHYRVVWCVCDSCSVTLSLSNSKTWLQSPIRAIFHYFLFVSFLNIKKSFTLMNILINRKKSICFNDCVNIHLRTYWVLSLSKPPEFLKIFFIKINK